MKMKRINILFFILVVSFSITVVARDKVLSIDNIKRTTKLTEAKMIKKEIELDKVDFEKEKEILWGKYQRQIEILQDQRRREINLLKQRLDRNTQSYKQPGSLDNSSKPIMLDKKKKQ